MEEPPPDLLKELECPVCLLIPRGGPVLQCILGHLVCRDCQPLLTKCPVCQAPFNKPSVTRNFVAETLLLSIQRGCRYEVLGCEYRSKESHSLVEHESTCEHKPPSPQPSPSNNLSDTMELLHVLLPLVLLVLRLLGFIMFMLLTFNTQLVTGPDHTTHTPFFSILADLELPDLVKETYYSLQSMLASQRHIAVAIRETFIAPITQLVKETFIAPITQLVKDFLAESPSWVEYLMDWVHILSLLIRDLLSRPVRRKCNYRAEGMIQHLFPDAWLPSSLSDMVWRFNSSTSASNMTMVWWAGNNSYTDGTQVRKFFMDRQDCEAAVVRSLCRWKLDLTGTPLGVASVVFMTGKEVVKEWTEEELDSTQEMIMTGVMVMKEDKLDTQIVAAENTEVESKDRKEKNIDQCLFYCPHLQSFRWIIKFKNILQ